MRVLVHISVLLRCYYVFVLLILEYCSPVWGSDAECHLQHLERQVYSLARLCSDKSFLSFCFDVMLLHCECCIRLIWTRITLCSASFH